MSDFGRVLAVNTHNVGDQLVAAHLEGDTVLHLDDASEFSLEGGTVLTDLGLLEYTTVDPDDDTMQLTDPLPGPLPDEARVELWDPDRGAVATETIASVELEGAEDDGDPFEATVPQALRAYLPDGIREGDGEVVEVDVDAETVTDLPGRTPSVDVIADRITTSETGQRVVLADGDNSFGLGLAQVELWTANSTAPGVVAASGADGFQVTRITAPSDPTSIGPPAQITFFDGQYREIYVSGRELLYLAADLVSIDGVLELRDDAVPTLSASTGWSLTEYDLKRFSGRFVQLYVRLSRTGADIAVSGTGNVTNDHLLRLPVGYRPATRQSLSPADTGRVVSVAVGTDGFVDLSAVAGSGNLATGDVISAAGMFIAA